MKPYVLKLFRRIAATNTISSNVSIGTASAFVLSAAGLSLVVDRPVPPEAFGGGWMLRGAVGSSEPDPAVAPVHAATQKLPQLG